jgi:hypothetical protein
LLGFWGVTLQAARAQPVLLPLMDAFMGAPG